MTCLVPARTAAEVRPTVTTFFCCGLVDFALLTATCFLPARVSVTVIVTVTRQFVPAAPVQVTRTFALVRFALACPALATLGDPTPIETVWTLEVPFALEASYVKLSLPENPADGAYVT
jgi:hypothetical protein